MEKSSCQICRLNLIGDGENTAQNVQTIYQSAQRICLLIYLCKRKRRYLNLAFTAYKIAAMRLKTTPMFNLATKKTSKFCPLNFDASRKSNLIV